ncbi:MAG: VWA domain-containing protein [Myxococcales bacterium]|nr:VWA domain-containing protein [Myxococcales bacterium]
MDPKLRMGARSLAWAAVSVAAWLCSCTDAQLELRERPPPFRDDKLALTGDFCTIPPESRVFPLRVLFVVDSSDSMNVTDPPDPVTGETNRERAVRETWQSLLRDQPEGVRVGIVRFSAEAQGRTGVDQGGDGLTDTYFTADTDLLTAATESLGVTDRTTNYLNALGEARFEIRTELLAAAQESLPLSKYVVIFVSDGIPDAQTGDERANAFDNILATVDQLKDLAKQFRVGHFEFNTAYVSAGEGPVRDLAAQELLKRMAEVGEGTFRSFPSGEALNFLDDRFIDFTVIRRVFTLKSLSVVNVNTISDDDQVQEFIRLAELRREAERTDAAIPLLPESMGGSTVPGMGAPMMGDPAVGGAGMGSDAGVGDAGTGEDRPLVDPRLYVDLDGSELPGCGEPLVDSDGDGLSDYVEGTLGTDLLVPDSDDDGINDRLEWRTNGLDPLDPADARCYIPAPCVDMDGDMSCDCVQDLDMDGTCDCVDEAELTCADDLGHDCVDVDMDGFCDCPDADRDGRCDYPDRDGDTLSDCEEVLFGTSQLGNDSDADGLPDFIEARAESNPTDADRMDDGDLDQTINGIEVLSNTDPWCDDSRLRSRTAYRYQVESSGLSDGQSCYAFSARNITLVPTEPNPRAAYPGNGWNRVLVFIGEVSFDDPNAFAAYRIACVMAAYEVDGNLKSPPSGLVNLKDEDFHDASEFDADRHCKYP